MKPAPLWQCSQPLVLASRSAARRALLEAAAIPVEVRPADIDERAIFGADGMSLAADLAEAKALAAARAVPGRLVLGADQTMSLGDALIHKAASRDEARQTLMRLSGRTHHLHSAAALVQDGAVLWRGVACAAMTMRAFDDRFLAAYLDAAGDAVTETVGGYQLEGLGIHLFAAADGDHATILGLPLLQLLAALRALGALA